MEYLIRYRKAAAAEQSEFTVEANSPTEALVKFRHTCDGGQAPAAAETVVSVCQPEGGELVVQ